MDYTIFMRSCNFQALLQTLHETNMLLKCAQNE